MKKALALAIIIGSFSFAAPALACSPAVNWPPSPEENLTRKDLVFVGTVASVAQDKSIYGDYRVTFDVGATYKGSLKETRTIIVRSSSAACGYDDGYKTFEKGSVWAVYASGSETEGFRSDSLSLNIKYGSVAKAKSAMEGFGFSEITEGPRMCTMQYAPVCGRTKEGTLKTYGNSCMLSGDPSASFVSEGECPSTTIPSKDLWIGKRGTEVTWLQEFLIQKASGTASMSLKSVGATGYFGNLTRSALREYQAAHDITPAAGYFGVKTRAQIQKDL